MSTCTWPCQHVAKWWGWFTALKQWTPVLWTQLSIPPKRSKQCIETFPQSEVGIKMVPSSPSISDHVLKMWKIFITPHCCQVSYQTRSFKSTPLCLPTGWIYISYQYKLTISMKIFTHNSKPNILIFCISSRFGGKSAVYVQPSFLWVFNSTCGVFNWF